MGVDPDILYSALAEDLSDLVPGSPMAINKIHPDATYRQFAANQLLASLIKKWIPSDTRNADLAAREKFLACNNACKDWTLSLEFESDAFLYGEFRKEVDAFFSYPDGQWIVSSFKDILDKARCGPGASLGAKSNSSYAKLFSSKMAVTDFSLYTTYRDYIGSDPNWSKADVQRHSEYGYPSIVRGSKTTFVPKTKDISRMVCTEPSLNMFFQLGFGTLIEERLRSRFAIDLRTQPLVNRRLSQIGSKTGEFSTIDLSSASDLISLNLCRQVLPVWVSQICEDLRSPFTTFDDGTSVCLNMMSTMGNGFTFPLQTALFSCLIRAAYTVAGVTPIDGASGNWSCFGDDLICLNSVFRNVTRLLGLCGFQVNSEKTFNEGPFRESCGTDWFYGQPVRGVYIKALHSKQDLCVAINLLNAWSSYTGIHVPTAVGYLSSWLRDFQPVPFDENLDAGVRVPRSYLEQKHMRFDRNGTMVYRAYRSRPKYVEALDGVFRYPGGFRDRFSYNPEGLLLAILIGEFGTRGLSVRQSKLSYRKSLRCSPFWDYVPATSTTNGLVLDWRRWETAVLINLSNP